MKAPDLLALLAVVTSVLTAAYSYRLSRQSYHVSTCYGVVDLFREFDRVFIADYDIPI